MCVCVCLGNLDDGELLRTIIELEPTEEKVTRPSSINPTHTHTHTQTVQLFRLLFFIPVRLSYYFFTAKLRTTLQIEKKWNRTPKWWRRITKTNQGLPVKKNHFNVDIFSILVQEILEKVRHRLVGDVSANDDVPELVRFGRKIGKEKNVDQFRSDNRSKETPHIHTYTARREWIKWNWNYIKKKKETFRTEKKIKINYIVGWFSLTKKWNDSLCVIIVSSWWHDMAEL